MPGLDIVFADSAAWSPDVRITWTVGPYAPVAGLAGAQWYVSPDCDDAGAPLLTVDRDARAGTFTMRYSEGAAFVVAGDGSRVDASWCEPLTLDDAATYLLGPVLGFVMRLRGTVPMHASAVVVDGRGLLFLGPEGAGKSTTVAAFARMGVPVLSDDIVPLVTAAGRWHVLPGHPRVSVWPDVAAGLFGSVDALPAISPAYPKRYLHLRGAGRFQSAAVPLAGLCVLRPRHPGPPDADVRTLPAREALMELVANTYCGYLLDAPMRAHEFAFLGALADAVPVHAVSFSASFDGIEASCRAIVSRLGQAA